MSARFRRGAQVEDFIDVQFTSSVGVLGFVTIVCGDVDE